MSDRIRLMRNPLKVWAQEAFEELVVDRSSRFNSVFIINDPAIIQKIMLDEKDKFVIAEPIRRTIGAFAPRSLPVVQGHKWKLLRRAIAPVLKTDKLRTYVPQFRDLAERAMQSWNANKGQHVNIADVTRQVAAQTVAMTFLDEDETYDSSEIVSLTTLLREAGAGLDLVTLLNLPAWLPSLRRARVNRKLEPFRDNIRKLFASVRAGEPLDGDGIIHAMITTAQNSETHMDADVVFDNVAFMIAAGFETSAHTMTATLFLLALHPGIAALVTAELDEKFRAESVDAEMVMSLELLNACIQEAMRLYAPLPHLIRQSNEPLFHNGVEFPKNSYFLICPYIVHRHFALWDDPHRFKPSRFLLPNAAGNLKWQYFPFGQGARKCIGDRYAERELLTILATWLAKFKPKLSGDPPSELSAKVSMKLSPDFHANMVPR